MLCSHCQIVVDGAGPPEWDPRPRIGAYLGHSSFHVDTATLTFNFSKGRVTLHTTSYFMTDLFSIYDIYGAGVCTPIFGRSI